MKTTWKFWINWTFWTCLHCQPVVLQASPIEQQASPAKNFELVWFLIFIQTLEEIVVCQTLILFEIYWPHKQLVTKHITKCKNKPEKTVVNKFVNATIDYMHILKKEELFSAFQVLWNEEIIDVRSKECRKI